MSPSLCDPSSAYSGPHIIFDMDGILLDTEPVYLSVEGALVSELSPGADLTTILHKLLGRTGADTARITLDAFAIDMSVDAYLSLRNSRLEPAMRSTPLLPGVASFVRDMAAAGVRMSVATSSPRVLLDAKRADKADFFAAFEHVVCGDDVSAGKPSPEIFLKAAAAMGVDPKNCVVFEDAPAGVRGAKAAGMTCIALPNLDVDRKLYSDALPDGYMTTWDDFDPTAVGLPARPSFYG
jgi:pseudouridine 5'-phosphatase